MRVGHNSLVTTKLVALGFPIKWEFGVLVFLEGGKLGNQRKTLGVRTRTNNKLNPCMTLGLGIELGSHWWEASSLSFVVLGKTL